MKRLLAFLAAMLVVWPAMAQDASIGIGRSITKGSRAGYTVRLDASKTAGTYVIGEAFPKAVVGFELGSAFVGTLYACETTVYAAGTCTAYTSPLSSDITNGIFDSTRRWYLLTITTEETGSDVSYLNIYGGYEVSSSGGTDAAALQGAYMTWGTVEYLSRLKGFEGLDPTIPWTRYYIDPYAGDDANPGTYSQPIKTIGKWKQMATFGTWFTIKNASHPTQMVISNQTFPYPASEACVVGETVTYDTGGSTSKILDIDVASGVIVFETLTGNRLAASDVISAGSQTGSACAWTVGTREPSIWDGATTVCNSIPTTACTVGGGCTRGGACLADCGSGPVCIGVGNAAIMLETTPTRYDGRIVSMIDVEDPTRPVLVHGDKEQPSENDADDNGLFMARGNSAYGCLGVANIHVSALQNDAIAQHEEGCVKALNFVGHSWNDSADLSNNIITTHGGSSGRGQVVVVNGSGYSNPYTATSGGAPVAPTGLSALTLIGTGRYYNDLSTQNDTATTSAFTGTSGHVAIVGHEFDCANKPGPANGCHGATFISTGGDSTFKAARTMFRMVSAATSLAALNLQGAASNPLVVDLYRNTYDAPSARGVAVNPNATGPITLTMKGSLWSDSIDYHVYDNSSDGTLTTAIIDGVYDDDGGNSWDIGASAYTTAAAAHAANDSWTIAQGQSVQTDSTELTSDERCASTGECWDSYTESWSFTFPEVIYDYLPVPIEGYTESGQRNYGAR